MYTEEDMNHAYRLGVFHAYHTVEMQYDYSVKKELLTNIELLKKKPYISARLILNSEMRIR